MLHFHYPFISDGHLDWCYFFDVMHKPAKVVGVIDVSEGREESFGYMPRSGGVGSYSSAICNFLRNLQIDFHNFCTHLYSEIEKR